MKENPPTLSQKEAFSLLMAFCSREEHCEYDVLQKIRLMKLPEDWSNELIANLRENNFISHERYAQAFVNDKFRFNKWGKVKIQFTLAQKRIPSSIIQQALANIEEEAYIALIKTELQKKASSISTGSAYERKAKVYRFGLSKGFEPEYIQDILDTIFK